MYPSEQGGEGGAPGELAEHSLVYTTPQDSTTEPTGELRQWHKRVRPYYLFYEWNKH